VVRGEAGGRSLPPTRGGAEVDGASQPPVSKPAVWKKGGKLGDVEEDYMDVWLGVLSESFYKMAEQVSPSRYLLLILLSLLIGVLPAVIAIYMRKETPIPPPSNSPDSPPKLTVRTFALCSQGDAPRVKLEFVKSSGSGEFKFAAAT